jgi:hypothetical protein
LLQYPCTDQLTISNYKLGIYEEVTELDRSKFECGWFYDLVAAKKKQLVGEVYGLFSKSGTTEEENERQL